MGGHGVSLPESILDSHLHQCSNGGADSVVFSPQMMMVMVMVMMQKRALPRRIYTP